MVHENYMHRCLQLAARGLGNVSPNPLVGSVIVHNERIIGEGYHRVFGQAHAEVNAIQSVTEKNRLTESTLYVNLEPCSHYGKTPPCTELIIKSGIPKVVIGMQDPFEKVAGRGIVALKKAGVDVLTSCLEDDCRHLNRRFITFQAKKRPFIILKWAQTLDGFMDMDRMQGETAHVNWITNDKLKLLVHRWRTEEDAVMIGTHTALNDNPQLTVRDWSGRNPIRLVLDEKLSLPTSLNVFDNSATTLVFTGVSAQNTDKMEYIQIDFHQDVLPQVMSFLYQRGIMSILVEGGRELLDSFISAGLWDEARIFTGNKVFRSGLQAPQLPGKLTDSIMYNQDRLVCYENPESKV